MKVTRIAYSKHLTANKFSKLQEIATLCSYIRRDVWHQYGGISHMSRHHRTIRDEDWMRTGRGNRIGLPAKVWKATLEDTLCDIKAYRAASIDKGIKSIYGLDLPVEERKSKVKAIRNNEWLKDSIAHRLMRKIFVHGSTCVNNQIILDEESYTSFIHNGYYWIAISSLIKGKRLAIPLGKYSTPINGQIRLILRNNLVEVHHCVDQSDSSRPCGNETLGLDKGYTEVFTDQHGETYGDGLGRLLTKESDRKSVIYKGRNKVTALFKKYEANRNIKKSNNIKNNNLGRKKLDKQKSIHTSIVKTLIHTSVHQVLDVANTLVVEDLSFSVKKKQYSSRMMNRRLSGWVKGLIRYALESCSSRRGASVILVNAAYTSQWCECCSSFGVRNGDTIYCKSCGVVYPADQNAASNILYRASDLEISLKTSYRVVRSILENRVMSSVESAQPGL